MEANLWVERVATWGCGQEGGRHRLKEGENGRTRGEAHAESRQGAPITFGQWVGFLSCFKKDKVPGD